ncbi:MAG: hypothetical protein IKF97_01775 [Clostridia bacterium]|nr:hypothetical protein [Clostridia bacterium]
MFPFLNFFSNGTEQENSRTKNIFNILSSTDYSEPIFSILGINLYLDDLLILCILFTLYLNGVKDEMLFISLILLLFC